MKKILILLIFSLILSSCDKDSKANYSINVNAKGVSDNAKVRLAVIDSSGKQVIKDSTTVMNEKFSLEGSVEEPSVHFLSVEGRPGNVIFMLENSTITIELSDKILMESKVTGSESNKGYEAFQQGMLKFKDQGTAIMAIYNELGTSPAPKTRDSIGKAMQKLRDDQGRYPLSFVQDHKDEYFSLNLIELESSRPYFEILAYKEAFENLSSKLKDSKKGAVVKQKLDKLYEDYKAKNP